MPDAQAQALAELITRRQQLKVALVACMHKLLRILNALLRAAAPWRPPQEVR